MITRVFGIGCLAFLLALFAGNVYADTDLSVGWIQRLPKINYVWNSKNPKVEGWPKTGQEVTWVANVWNLALVADFADHTVAFLTRYGITVKMVM